MNPKYTVTWAIALPVWVATIICIYWGMIDIRSPIVPVPDPESLSSIPELKPGGTLTIQRRYIVYKNAELTLYRRIVDHIVYTLPHMVTPVSVGVHNEFSHLVLPKSLLPGLYVYTLRACYDNNPITTSCVNFPDEPFYIMNLDGSLPASDPEHPKTVDF